MASSSACRVAYGGGVSRRVDPLRACVTHISELVGTVPCLRNDSAVPYKDASDWHFL